jgi:hypothetical protein
MRDVMGSYRVAIETAVIVAILVAVGRCCGRWV